MKNAIYNFYNIKVDEIGTIGNNYYFYIGDDFFIFYLVENDLEVVKKTYEYFIINNLYCHRIIENKDRSLFSNIENKNYALLKVKGILNYEIKFEEFKFYKIDGKPHDWGELWGERLDYYEIQLRELGYNYQTLLNSFGFYAGITENAILYYNLTLDKFKEDYVVSIQHNRMNFPCYEINYYNPLNFVIDYNVRDIAEYIKSYIISDAFNIDDIIDLINKINFNKLTFNLFYSRLLYPTFYFDIFDKIILNNGNENDVIIILDKLDEYLFTLKQIYLNFNEKYEMFNIEWLTKNVET